MITWFLQRRLRRIGARPIADKTTKASIRESLIRAGYLETRSLWLVRTRAFVATSGLFVVGLGGMTSYTYASDAVLPQTALYPVRQKLEALELKLAPTPAARVRVEVRQKAKRLKEVKVLRTLHKKLPALHAEILREQEQMEREAARTELRKNREEQKRTSTTTTRLPNLEGDILLKAEDTRLGQKERLREKIEEPAFERAIPVIAVPTSTRSIFEEKRLQEKGKMRSTRIPPRLRAVQEQLRRYDEE